MLIVAPSGGGKTVLITSLLLDIFRKKSGASCFQRIFVFSPSLGLDHTWESVKTFQNMVMKVPKDEDSQLYFREWDPGALEHIVHQQSAIVTHQKQLGMKQLYQICIVLDDHADNPALRHSRALQMLFIRGRHSGITTIASVQAYRTLSAVIRKNATALCVFHLRNDRELESILEENSAVYGAGKKGRDIVRAIYEAATEKPHDFLWVNLVAKDRDDLFWRNFEERLVHDES